MDEFDWFRLCCFTCALSKTQVDQSSEASRCQCNSYRHDAGYSDDDDVQALGNIAGQEDNNRQEDNDAPDSVIPSDTDDDIKPLEEDDSANAEGTEISGLHEFWVEQKKDPSLTKQWTQVDQPDSPLIMKMEDGILYHRSGDKLGNNVHQLVLDWLTPSPWQDTWAGDRRSTDCGTIATGQAWARM